MFSAKHVWEKIENVSFRVIMLLLLLLFCPFFRNKRHVHISCCFIILVNKPLSFPKTLRSHSYRCCMQFPSLSEHPLQILSDWGVWNYTVMSKHMRDKSSRSRGQEPISNPNCKGFRDIHFSQCHLSCRQMHIWSTDKR